MGHASCFKLPHLPYTATLKENEDVLLFFEGCRGPTVALSKREQIRCSLATPTFHFQRFRQYRQRGSVDQTL